MRLIPVGIILSGLRFFTLNGKVECRADIESAIFYCKLYPDKTLPILSTTKKTPCSWGSNGIALYMYQKHTAIAKTIPHPAGWGEVSVVGFNKNGMPFRGGPGLLAKTYLDWH